MGNEEPLDPSFCSVPSGLLSPPPCVPVAVALALELELAAAAAEAEVTDALDADDIEARTADGRAVCTARKVF